MDTITTTQKELINRLKEIQEQKNLSDHRFARVLKVSRPNWSLTRTGKKPLGITMLRAISRTFPEFDRLIIQFLKEDNNGH